MTAANKNSLKYLKFLHLVQAIRGLSDFPVLDVVEDRLLNLFAAAWHQGKKLTVLEAMAISPDVSPTTVHRRLKTLRKKELITLSYDLVDNRIKYIEPTEKANQYFAQLSQCLSQAAKKG